MTIAYEPPTLAELAVLTQNDDQRRLADLVRRCSPFFRYGNTGDQKERIVFTNTQFKDRLSVVAHGYEELQKRQYHGLMALRCFAYIKSFYGSGGSAREVDVLPHRSSSVTARVMDETNVIVVTDKEDDLNGLEETDPASTQNISLSVSYPIRYLVTHLGEGLPDVAQELYDDDPGFWGQKSSLRDAWLVDFRKFKSDLQDLNTNGMSALHIAAGIGATELVSILVGRNGASSLAWTNDKGITAVRLPYHKRSEQWLTVTASRCCSEQPQRCGRIVAEDWHRYRGRRRPCGHCSSLCCALRPLQDDEPSDSQRSQCQRPEGGHRSCHQCCDPIRNGRSCQERYGRRCTL